MAMMADSSAGRSLDARDWATAGLIWNPGVDRLTGLGAVVVVVEFVVVGGAVVEVLGSMLDDGIGAEVGAGVMETTVGVIAGTASGTGTCTGAGLDFTVDGVCIALSVLIISFVLGGSLTVVGTTVVVAAAAAAVDDVVVEGISVRVLPFAFTSALVTPMELPVGFLDGMETMVALLVVETESKLLTSENDAFVFALEFVPAPLQSDAKALEVPMMALGSKAF